MKDALEGILQISVYTFFFLTSRTMNFLQSTAEIDPIRSPSTVTDYMILRLSDSLHLVKYDY